MSAGAVALCPSDRLAERGLAHSFELLWRGHPQRAFALRIDGQVVAYLNRCAHVPAELDWNPDAFLDAEGQFIVCSIHGAVYEPATGRCAGGPCGRSGLIPVPAAESGGMVYWYPSPDLAPLKPSAFPP